MTIKKKKTFDLPSAENLSIASLKVKKFPVDFDIFSAFNNK